MWRIHRYYLTELCISTGIATAVLSGIVLLAVVHRAFERAAGFGLLIALRTTGWFALDLAPHVLGIATLIGTVWVFGRARHDREVTALTAGGVPKRAIIGPALLLGVVCATANAVVLHYVVPTAHWEKYRLGGLEVVRDVVLRTGMHEDRFQLGDHFSMTWTERSEGGWLEDVTIRIGRRDSASSPTANEIGTPGVRTRGAFHPASLNGIWHAEHARLRADSSATGAMSLQLRGVRRSAPRGPFAERLELIVDLEDLSRGKRRQENERDLTSDQLLAELSGGRAESPIAARYTFHRRGCFALLPLVFAPLGFVVGVVTGRLGRASALALALVPVAAFYLGDALARRVVASTDNPWFAYAPIGVLAVGTALLGRAARSW
jgi:lipopolysaccharide export LptBFGC system permease protein LptF